MKTFILALLPVGAVYVLMFFLWEPLYIIANNNHYQTSARILSQYEQYAYAYWIKRLGADSKIKELRLRNSLYWCEKITGCSGYSYVYSKGFASFVDQQ